MVAYGRVLYNGLAALATLEQPPFKTAWKSFFKPFRKGPRTCRKCGVRGPVGTSAFCPEHRDVLVTHDNRGREILVRFSHLAWVCSSCGYEYRTLTQDDPRNPIPDGPAKTQRGGR